MPIYKVLFPSHIAENKRWRSALHELAPPG